MWLVRDDTPDDAAMATLDTGGEVSLLARRRFVDSMRGVPVAAGLDLVFRVVVFVVDGSCPCFLADCRSR